MPGFLPEVAVFEIQGIAPWVPLHHPSDGLFPGGCAGVLGARGVQAPTFFLVTGSLLLGQAPGRCVDGSLGASLVFDHSEVFVMRFG